MENEKEKNEPEKKPMTTSDKAIMWALVVMLLALVGAMFSLCSHISSGSGYDDRWDRLEHSVKSDPYYRQWQH